MSNGKIYQVQKISERTRESKKEKANRPSKSLAKKLGNPKQFALGKSMVHTSSGSAALKYKKEKIRKSDDYPHRRDLKDTKENASVAPISTEDSHRDLSPFLRFLDADIKAHPERIQSFDADLLNRIQDLVGDFEIDLDAPLSPDDA